nr:MAG TPA_asm: hypothetical protein [Caudoviricetes sp.]
MSVRHDLIASSVWNTDLIKAVLVKQSSVQAISQDTPSS